jgi:hypothetical protein
MTTQLRDSDALIHRPASRVIRVEMLEFNARVHGGLSSEAASRQRAAPCSPSQKTRLQIRKTSW